MMDNSSLSKQDNRLSPLTKILSGITIFGAALGITYFFRKKYIEEKLPTVPYVDIKKILGKWFLIGTLSNDEICKTKNNTIHYALLENGKIEVLNESFIIETQIQDSTLLTAGVEEDESNAKWWIQNSNILFKRKTWIVDLSKDYNYIVFANPNKKSFHILARNKSLHHKTLTKINNILVRLGFNTDNIVYIKHDN